MAPLRARRISSRMAAEPPRDDDPRDESTSKCAIVRAISSPSLLWEMRTEIGVRKRHLTIISRWQCQKAMMYCGVRARFSTRTCRTRNVQ